MYRNRQSFIGIGIVAAVWFVDKGRYAVGMRSRRSSAAP